MLRVSRFKRPLAFLLVLATTTSSAGCSLFYTFSREAEARPGEVVGRAVHADDGEPAPYAKVQLRGLNRTLRAGADGSFRVPGLSVGQWLLELGEDADGNGWPERSLTVKARVLRHTPPLEVEVGQGGGELGVPFTEGVPEPARLVLGDVELEGVLTVKGEVSVTSGGGPVAPAAVGLVGRVLVIREECLLAEDGLANTSFSPCPSVVGADVEALVAGAEVAVAVDADGRYAIPAIAAGRFQLVALLYQPRVDGSLGDLVAVSAPVVLEGAPQDRLEPGRDVPPFSFDAIDGGAPALEERRDVELLLVPDLELFLVGVNPFSVAYATFLPPGTGVPPCLPFIPEGPLAGYPRSRIAELRASELEDEVVRASFSAPVGTWQLQVCAGVGEGFLQQVLIPPGPAGEVPVYGPLRIGFDDACGQPRDCDGDGLVGLAPLAPAAADYEANARIWRDCWNAGCGAAGYRVAAGQPLPTCTVTVDGVPQTFDCDDDGDGQPDPTEGRACYGPGFGSDVDGDGLCGGQDAFPTCAANDAALCPADDDPAFVPSSGLAGDVDEAPCAPTVGSSAAFCTLTGDDAEEPRCLGFQASCDYNYAREPECRLDEDCPDGLICNVSTCVPFECDRTMPTTSCPGGEVCISDSCYAACEGPSECGPDQVCGGVGGVKGCLPRGPSPEGAPCLSDFDCQPGLFCLDDDLGLFQEGARVCVRECSLAYPGFCPEPQQECVSVTEGNGDTHFVCVAPSIDLLCTCRDRATGDSRSVYATAAAVSPSCEGQAAADLWQTCAGFMNDQPFDAGVPEDDGGVPDDAGADGGTDGGALGCPSDTDADPQFVPFVHVGAIEGDEFELDTVAGGFANPQGFVLEGDPSGFEWLAIDPDTGRLTGTVATGPGTQSDVLRVRVSDDLGTWCSAPFVVITLPTTAAYFDFDDVNLSGGNVYADPAGSGYTVFHDFDAGPAPSMIGLGQALSFETAAPSLATINGLVPSGSFAVSLWFLLDEPPPPGGFMVLAEHGDGFGGETSGWKVEVNEFREVVFKSGDGLTPGAQFLLSGTGAALEGVAHHVVASYNGATGDAALYVDGSLHASDVWSLPIAYANNTAYVGAGGARNESFLVGDIDELYYFAGSFDSDTAALAAQEGGLLSRTLYRFGSPSGLDGGLPADGG